MKESRNRWEKNLEMVDDMQLQLSDHGTKKKNS